jgi:L-fuconolactonase
MNQFAGNDLLKGVRHVVQDEPDPNFLLRADFNRGVSRLLDYGWVYDILIFAKQLPATIQFVDLHPRQPFVLDHIAKPTIAVGKFDRQWATDLRELAQRPNVLCKFSGVATEVRDTEWSIDTVRPYWDAMLESFGVERIMFGSDWPVCLLRTEYGRWVDCVKTLSAELSTAEQRLFWHDNAVKAYQL